MVQGSDGSFYGTTEGDITSGYYGSIFKITPSGTVTILHLFTDFSASGGDEYGGLALANDGNFYGAERVGGAYGDGCVFKITSSGAYTDLHDFAGTSDGAVPISLIQGSDGNLYGTTQLGGTNNDGVAYKITTSGSITVLHQFGSGSDGASPYWPMIQASDGNFYGTTVLGGANGGGSIYKITSSGTYSTLYSLNASTDGEFPYGGLVQAADGNLYGTDYEGGGGYGCVFEITLSGTFTNLRPFDARLVNNGDGAFPEAGLIQTKSGALYGTTVNGGSAQGQNGVGTIFEISIGPTPVAYWPFKEGAGTTVSDVTGDGYTQVLGGAGVTWSSAGKYGNCIAFSGSSTSYSQANNTTIGNFGTGNFTLSFWVNTSSAPLSNEYVIDKRASTGQGSFFDAGINTSGHVFAEVDQDSSGTNYIETSGTTTVTDGNWHLVNIVRSGDALGVYVDGTLNASSSAVGTANISNSAPLSLGYLYPYPTTSGYFFVGDLDDVRIYYSALDISQISSLYNAPQADWQFNANAGSTALDTSSQEANQTLGSDVAWSASGESGDCLDFNGGSTSYTQMTNTNFGNFGTNKFTVSYWVNASSAPASNEYVIDKRASTGNGSFFDTGINTSGHVFAEVDQDSSGTNYIITSGTASVTDGTWHLVSVVRSANTLSVYVDGDLNSSGTAAGTANISNTAPLSFGYLYPYSSYFYVGNLDDVRVYNGTALNIDWIQALYGGPSAYWPLSEGTGSVSADASSNDNTLTLSGTAWSASGKYGDCLSFSGSGDATSNNTSLGNFGTGDFSVSAWVNTTSSSQQFVMAKRGSASGDSSFFDIRMSSGKASAEVDQDTSGTNYNAVYGTRSIDDGSWHLITVVRSGAALSLYVDGTLDSSSTGAGTANISNAQSLSIGAWTATSSYYYSGLIDEVRVYPSALSSTEVSNLF